MCRYQVVVVSCSSPIAARLKLFAISLTRLGFCPENPRPEKVKLISLFYHLPAQFTATTAVNATVFDNLFCGAVNRIGYNFFKNFSSTLLC